MRSRRKLKLLWKKILYYKVREILDLKDKVYDINRKRETSHSKLLAKFRISVPKLRWQTKVETKVNQVYTYQVYTTWACPKDAFQKCWPEQKYIRLWKLHVKDKTQIGIRGTYSLTILIQIANGAVNCEVYSHTYQCPKFYLSKLFSLTNRSVSTLYTIKVFY